MEEGMELSYKGFEDGHFNIVEGMIDWVRVIDRNNNILYANKKMCDDVGRCLEGEKCYNLLKKDSKCTDCISCLTLETGKVAKKEVVYDNKTYNVVSSPLKNNDGEIIAAVEVFRDITYAKELTKELNEKSRKMFSDIRFAKNMQSRMLPPKEIYNGLSLDYIYEPSEMLSGDIFDVYKINDRYTGVYICDVVGHGVSAALLTMFVRQTLRTISKNQFSINKIMKELHKMFLSLNLDSDKYFSVFFSIYDKQTREFSYVNAGHNTNPILISNNEISFLEAKGYPICNIFDNVEYEIATIKLKLKDKLIFYTDGIVEAKNHINEEFGEDRLIDIVKEGNNILLNVYSEVNKFSANSLKDDCAIMLVEVVD